MRRLLFSLLLLVPGIRAAAQVATLPAYDPAATHRYVRATQLWPQVQGEAALGSHDYLLLAAQGRRITSYSNGNRSLGFDVRQALVGYEHFAGPHWSFGGTVRLLGDGGPVAVIPEVLLRHRSPIFGGLQSGQRLSVERTFSSGVTQALESGPEGQFWTRLRVDAERLLPLGSGSLALRPRLSYEAATHLRLQKADADPDERTIQFTNLRAEVGLRASEQFDFTPWFAYQTQYRVDIVQYQYDANGKFVPISGGKTNAVTPTLGLDLRYTLLPAGGKSQRRVSLPTQH